MPSTGCGGFGADTARASAIQAALNSPRPAPVEAIVDPDEKPTDPDELRIGATVSAAELPRGNQRFPNARGDKTMARYSKSASGDVKGAMKRRKAGTLKSGRSGKTVKSKKEAIAIGLSEARAKGKKVPSKKSA
jgi:hypothetical protein